MKSKSIRAIAIVVAVLATFTWIAPKAQAQRRRSVTRHVAENTLSGIVTDAQSSEPIAGAMLVIRGKTGMTNADGEYEITEIPPGTNSITISRWGYETSEEQVVISDGANTANFTLNLLPFVQLTRSNGSTERFVTSTIEYGYVVPFTGTFSSPTLKVCTGNPAEPIALEPGTIAMIEGPATRVDTNCCSNFKGQQITVREKDGDVYQAVMLESCPPYDMYFIGRSLDEERVVYRRLDEVASINYP